MFAKKVKILAFLGALLLISSTLLADRTPLRTEWTVFTAQEDSALGRAMAQEAGRNLTFSKDTFVHGYINALGNQLAKNAPGYKYDYNFEVFMDPSIKAMAFPGGVIYVSSGLLQSARTESELAMILAHEIAHVVARHGSSQISRTYADQNNNSGQPSIANVMAALNGQADSAIARYSSDEEQQANLIATQMLYDARFDPRQLPTTFQRLANQSGRFGGEFFVNHPVPNNSIAQVRRELQNLGPLPANLRGTSPDLQTAQRHLRDEGANAPGRISDNRVTDNSVPLPSSRMRSYQGLDFEFRYPDNWTVTENGDSVTVAPDRGMVSGSLVWGLRAATFQPQQDRGFFGNSFNVGGQFPAGEASLTSATNQLVDDFRRSNRNMTVMRTVSRRIAGEPALVTELSNDSPIGGREVDRLYTVLRRDGVLQYFLGVSPQRDACRYTPVFDQIINSTRFY